MEWFNIKNKPKEGFGWFAVAILPRNHSGSDSSDKCDLAGDNDWRKSFGFSKAWLNNGEWYEPDANGNKTRNITRFVTHWGYLPEVPELTETFSTNINERFDERKSPVQIACDYIKDENRYNQGAKREDSFINGFSSCLKWLGLR